MEFISIVEIIGTIAFAMSGALTAIEKDLDYYGIGIFAITTSVGGGIVRDLLIDRPLPASLETRSMHSSACFPPALSFFSIRTSTNWRRNCNFLMRSVLGHLLLSEQRWLCGWAFNSGTWW